MQVGKTLVVLDNFRAVFKNMSVDVQDVIRSAILDGVDITPYINACADDPFRLDQIRLSIKERLNESLFSLSGPNLYQVRKMKKGNIDISPIFQHLGNKLSEEHTSYLIKWTYEGRNIKNLHLSIIPKSLLSAYDRGLSYGVDMSEFQNGNYSEEYLDALVNIKKSGNPIEKFLEGNWDIAVVKFFSSRSSSVSGNWWGILYNVVDRVWSVTTVSNIKDMLVYMDKEPMNYRLSEEVIKRGVKWTDNISKLYSDAAKIGINLNELLVCGESTVSLESKIASLKNRQSTKIGGSLRKKGGQS